MVNVFTNGIFDIIHPGHVHLLKHARQLGDTLTVGLNSDVSAKSIKGPNRPINNESDRFKVLKSIFYVDSVLIFDEPTPIELIKRVKPDILVKGGDYDVKNVVGKEFVESYGGKVVTIPFIHGFSTTNIISRILIAYKDYTAIKGGVL